jgi:hypothetical protein
MTGNRYQFVETRWNYAFYFPALGFAQRARCAAAIFARAAELMVRFFGTAPLVELAAGVGCPLAARIFAQRARAATAMRARPAGDIWRGPDFVGSGCGLSDELPPSMEARSDVSESIRSLISAARRSWAGVKFSNDEVLSMPGE